MRQKCINNHRGEITDNKHVHCLLTLISTFRRNECKYRYHGLDHISTHYNDWKCFYKYMHGRLMSPSQHPLPNVASPSQHQNTIVYQDFICCPATQHRNVPPLASESKIKSFSHVYWCNIPAVSYSERWHLTDSIGREMNKQMVVGRREKSITIVGSTLKVEEGIEAIVGTIELMTIVGPEEEARAAQTGTAVNELGWILKFWYVTIALPLYVSGQVDILQRGMEDCRLVLPFRCHSFPLVVFGFSRKVLTKDHKDHGTLIPVGGLQSHSNSNSNSNINVAIIRERLNHGPEAWVETTLSTRPWVRKWQPRAHTAGAYIVLGLTLGLLAGTLYILFAKNPL